MSVLSPEGLGSEWYPAVLGEPGVEAIEPVTHGRAFLAGNAGGHVLEADGVQLCFVLDQVDLICRQQPFMPDEIRMRPGRALAVLAAETLAPSFMPTISRVGKVC